jgi:hypothetical protein
MNSEAEEMDKFMDLREIPPEERDQCLAVVKAFMPIMAEYIFWNDCAGIIEGYYAAWESLRETTIPQLKEKNIDPAKFFADNLIESVKKVMIEKVKRGNQ